MIRAGERTELTSAALIVMDSPSPAVKIYSDFPAPTSAAKRLLMIALIGISSPLIALQSLAGYAHALRTTDKKIGSQFVIPAAEFSGEMRNSDWFYTLTSEGM